MRPPSRFSRPVLPSVFRFVLGGVLLLGLASAASAQFEIDIDPHPNLCIKSFQPIPSGVTARPPDDFGDFADHRWVHSSTNLQGQPAHEKFAAGLFWLPPAPAELQRFQSVVVVNNPDPAASTGVTIEFYDMLGNLLGSPFFVLGPEGTRVVPASLLQFGATPGLGAARVIGHDLPIVGETVHHADQVNLSAFPGGSVLIDTEAANLGLNSIQQLQMRQAGKTTLWYGPMPFSTTVPLEFLSGNAPMIQIVNPNPTPTTITLNYTSRNLAVVPPTTVTVPAFGSHLDLTLWNLFLPSYLGGPVIDDDFRVVVAGTQPILGDALMLDLFGGTGSLEVGGRFRMGSAMLGNTPSARLINPELTFEVLDPGVETMVGILNPTVTNVGPVSVQYFDRNGASLGADSFASFPRGFMVRIGPGLPSSPNYPAAGVFAGWMRITACKPGLVGWTMRQGGEHASSGSAPKKVWGEELTGGNGLEPGPGFPVVVATVPFVRKVSPLVRTWRNFPWPGYTTWVNDGAANAGSYVFRFFDHPGVNQTGAGSFAGLRFGATSFTYEDPLVTPGFPINLSGRVDTTNGGFDGIHVIGDPLVEWGIFDEEVPEDD